VTSRGPLGFGAEAGIALLLPVIWKIIDLILDELAKEATHEFIKRLKAFLFSKAEPSATPVESANKILELVRVELESDGIDPARARAVAATLLSVLSKNRTLLQRYIA
jgi:hypothetical protein